MAGTNGLIARIFSKSGLKTKTPSVRKEQRRSQRHQMELPTRFRIYLPSHPAILSDPVQAQIHDLSEHGIGILTHSMKSNGFHVIQPDPQTGEKCNLEIEIPYGNDPILVHGKAVWYIRNPDSEEFPYRVGVEFDNLSSDQRSRIKDFLNIFVSATEVN